MEEYTQANSWAGQDGELSVIMLYGGEEEDMLIFTRTIQKKHCNM